jgi:hypothetical protein
MGKWNLSQAFASVNTLLKKLKIYAGPHTEENKLVVLKVHKREKFFASDFELFTVL